MTAEDVKKVLGLQPHPREGGWYVRTYEAAEQVSASAFADPPLTTIDHAVFDNGRHIGQSLLRLIRGEAKPADIHYLEPVVLVPRKSDCPRQ